MGLTTLQIVGLVAGVLLLAVAAAAFLGLCGLIWYAYRGLMTGIAEHGEIVDAATDKICAAVTAYAEQSKSLTENVNHQIVAIEGTLKAWVLEQEQRIAVFKSGVDSLVLAQERSAKDLVSLNDLPKYVAGYAKVAIAHTREIEKLRKSVDLFASLVTKKDGRGAQSLITPDEEQDSERFEVSSLLALNPDMTPDEAVQKVRDAYEKQQQLGID